MLIDYLIGTYFIKVCKGRIDLDRIRKNKSIPLSVLGNISKSVFDSTVYIFKFNFFSI